MSGHVACLVTADHEVSGASGNEGSNRGVHWVGGSGPGRKRIRLNRKTPAHLAGLAVHSRSRVWKRLRDGGLSFVSIPDPKRRRSDQDYVGDVPVQLRTEVGKFAELCRPTSPGLHAV